MIFGRSSRRSMGFVSGILTAACAWAALAWAQPAWAGDVEVRVVGEAQQPLADTLVYLTGPGLTASVPAEPFVMDQANLTFVPRVLPVPVGSSVRFVNGDPEMHNVNSGAVASPFNFGLVRQGDAHTVRFDEAGVVPLLCDVHPHMRAWVVVLTTPHHAVTGSEGRVKIANVAAGAYTLVVWREGKKAREEKVEVTAAGLERTIALPVPAAAPAPASAKPRDGWTGTVSRVEARLGQAMAHAEAGREAEATTACYDAYFVHYEAEGMETAVRENVSSRRAFEDEERFTEVREGLLALARGKGTRDAVAQTARELVEALAEDARDLNAAEAELATAAKTGTEAGDGKRESAASVDAATGGAAAAGSRSVPMGAGDTVAAHPKAAAGLREADDALRGIRTAFAHARAAVAGGDRSGAAGMIGDAYFTQFHRFEAGLAVRHPSETAALERRFQTVRGEILAGAPADQVATALGALAVDIDALVTRTRATPEGPALLFLSSLLIIVREGFEALIILSAMLAFLARSGRTSMTRAVWSGALAAVVASFLTAWGFRSVLTASPARQEAMEGITMLLAAAVLFYVSWWFISNAQLSKWNRFVQSQVKGSITRGSLWSLTLVAFLAVYREGAETVLFYEALAAGSGGWTFPIVAGLAIGSVALAGVYLVFRLAAVRLPLKLLFSGTSTLLYVMAFVMAGKGIAELQEAGWVGVTPVGFLPTVPFLGVYPTVETAVLQAAILGLGVVGAVALKSLAAKAKTPEPVPVQTT